MVKFLREPILVVEGMGNAVARDRILLPKQYEVLVSTVDTSRGPEFAKLLDGLLGIKSRFETAVKINPVGQRDHWLVIAEYPDKDIALIGHEKIVENVRSGRLDFEDIRTGKRLIDAKLVAVFGSRFRVQPRRRPPPEVQVQRHVRRRVKGAK